ncbi:MAG: hypothetical protein P8P74_02175 [Crocinitomicaceae bacterium]|nr:hypothetical protein [Crocinitomicaceae bacterium]
MKKRWVRVVVSLLIGGGLQESVRISTGKEIGPLFFFGAIVSYIIISVIVYVRNMWLLQREVDVKLKKNDELIDDL